MANVRQRTITYPGLNNVYTFPDEADDFNAALFYKKGTHVIYDGLLWRLTADHPAGVSWANTSKTPNPVKLCKEVQDNAEQLVMTSNTEPTYANAPFNQIWVKPNNDEVEIPTMDEFGDLKSAINDFVSDIGTVAEVTGVISKFTNASSLTVKNYSGQITVYNRNIVKPLNYGVSPYVDGYEYTTQNATVKLLGRGRFGIERSSAGSGNIRMGLFSNSYSQKFILPAGKYTMTVFNLGRYKSTAGVTPTGDIKLYYNGSYATSIFVENETITKNSYTFTADGETETNFYIQIAASVILDNIIGVQIEYGETATDYADVVTEELTVSDGDFILQDYNPVTVVTGTLFSTNGNITIESITFDFKEEINELDERVDALDETIRGMIEKKISIPWIICSHTGRVTASAARNTIQGYNNAWLDGATQVEMDARLTSDGKYVMHHNDTVTTINGDTYLISENTQAMISDLVVYTDAKYGNWKVPTLEDALKFCCYTGMTVNLDCKYVNASTLATTVVDCGMSGKVTYANIDDSYASTILAIDPLASFCFAATTSNINTWANVLTNPINRNKTVVLASTLSTELVELIKSKGFMVGLGVIEGSSEYFAYYPDIVMYEYDVNMTAVNNAWLDTIHFFDE